MGMRPALALAADVLPTSIRRFGDVSPGLRQRQAHVSTLNSEACRSGLWIAAYCSHQPIGESEADAARQFPPPDMSLGLPSRRATRSIFLRIPIRFGKWKLAQEGSPLARKRSSMNILAASRCFTAGRCLQPAWRQSRGERSDRYPSKTMFRFPLTTLKLSRRIAGWTSGGTLLKLQRPL
jgi:hypothetical protein